VNTSITTGQANSVAFAAGSQARNNIYWNSRYDAIRPLDMDYEFSNSTIPGSHSISNGLNPFVNLTGTDFHIISTQGANLPRGNGENGSLFSEQPVNLNFDSDGNPRPSNGAWDMGAYEFNPNGPK
jgi:hypothetical protein